MRKVFLEGLGYNIVGFIFGNKMIAFDCETIEQAKAMDISGIEGFDTADEAAINCCTEVYPFVESEWKTVTEF